MLGTMAMAPAPRAPRGPTTPPVAAGEAPASVRAKRPGRGGLRPWAASRAVPLVGAGVFSVAVVNYSLWWWPVVHHVDAWWVPGDFWATWFAGKAFVGGHWAALYGGHSRLTTLPGVLVVLAPVVALAQSLHLSVGAPYTAVSTPTAWLALEPVALAAAVVALCALDALARRLGVPARRRAWLVGAEVVALWNLLVVQWHPEDALAVALAVWALLGALDGRWARCAWLVGAAVALQPLAVLAVPALATLAGWRRLPGLAARAAAPVLAVVAGPLAVAPGATLRGVLAEEGRLVSVADHPTPWIHLAPHLAGGVVAAGPARAVAVVAAAVVSVVACRRHPRPETVVWVVALSFALRTCFEAVMVAYYLWPALALALVLGARASAPRLAVAGACCCFATAFAQLPWQGEWAWWSVLVACSAGALAAAWPTGAGAPVPTMAGRDGSGTDTACDSATPTGWRPSATG